MSDKKIVNKKGVSSKIGTKGQQVTQDDCLVEIKENVKQDNSQIWGSAQVKKKNSRSKNRNQKNFNQNEDIENQHDSPQLKNKKYLEKISLSHSMKGNSSEYIKQYAQPFDQMANQTSSSMHRHEIRDSSYSMKQVGITHGQLGILSRRIPLGRVNSHEVKHRTQPYVPGPKAADGQVDYVVDPDYKYDVENEDDTHFKEALDGNDNLTAPILFQGNTLKPNPNVQDQKIINQQSIPRPFMRCVHKDISKFEENSEVNRLKSIQRYRNSTPKASRRGFAGWKLSQYDPNRDVSDQSIASKSRAGQGNEHQSRSRTTDSMYRPPGDSLQRAPVQNEDLNNTKSEEDIHLRDMVKEVINIRENAVNTNSEENLAALNRTGGQKIRIKDFREERVNALPQMSSINENYSNSPMHPYSPNNTSNVNDLSKHQEDKTLTDVSFQDKNFEKITREFPRLQNQKEKSPRKEITQAQVNVKNIICDEVMLSNQAKIPDMQLSFLEQKKKLHEKFNSEMKKSVEGKHQNSIELQSSMSRLSNQLSPQNAKEIIFECTNEMSHMRKLLDGDQYKADDVRLEEEDRELSKEIMQSYSNLRENTSPQKMKKNMAYNATRNNIQSNQQSPDINEQNFSMKGSKLNVSNNMNSEQPKKRLKQPPKVNIGLDDLPEPSNL